MEQVFAFMLLVGCSPDASQCSEIPVATPTYSSIEECRADLPLQMRLTDTYDARVMGACEAVDEAMMEQDATVEWAVSRNGELKVALVPVEPAATASLDALEENVRLASR
ncbi:hypothetical protein [Aureimonas populi]|uniref:Uncharacterized protein n=1 Tax=Aureimonas populi TaxID=1701758 RepID=A0ABW5CJR9_9HYPH|nr:hypothetical protein [Aureimonas populi]